MSFISMRSLNLFSLVFLFWLHVTPGLAIPLNGRVIDLDNNGTPDFCVSNSDGSSTCLENGSWTVIYPSQTVVKRPSTASIIKASTITDSTITATATSIQATISPITSALPTGSLPSPAQFKTDNGTNWSIKYVGDIQFTGTLASKSLQGDKCRSSKLGDKIIWNCGDMQCLGSTSVCGFAMGPAFYGTDNVMTINTTGVLSVQDNGFVSPWSGDSSPAAPQWIWGMDTSNIAAINDTHGVAYAWEIWRNVAGGSFIDRGNAVASVTLGSSMPIANRTGPLLTGPDAVQLGLLAILRDGNYIYMYSTGGASGLTVTRVTASDDVFDVTKYQSLQHGTTSWSTAIPNKSDTNYGMVTANSDGKFGCSVYGSVFYNNYLQKYTIICSIFNSFVNMYTSDTPYGPWSAEYSLLTGWNGYGSMAHPMYSPGGSHKEIYLSQGPGTKLNMFKLSFGY